MKLNKLFAGVLAAAMMMSIGVSAMAATYDKDYVFTDNDDMSQVSVKVDFTLVGEGESPAMDFTLVETDENKANRAVSGNSDLKVSDMPDLGIITPASVLRGAADNDTTTYKNIVINLNRYTKVGVYTYYLTESHTETAGVSASGEKTVRLVVTVVNKNDYTGSVRIAAVHAEVEGEKSDVIAPTYTANKLTVSKEVKGNLGDKTKGFDFTATFTNENEDKEYTSAIGFLQDDDVTATKNADGSYSFTLAHGQDIEFKNIPQGVKVVVNETDYSNEDYETYVNNGTTQTREYTETMNASALTAAYVNKKGAAVDTGVILDNAPYIVMLAVVAGGVLFVASKKRREE